jgi:hypothetical protein
VSAFSTNLYENFLAYPFLFVVILLAVGALFAIKVSTRKNKESRVDFNRSCFSFSLMALHVFPTGLFPLNQSLPMIP